MQLKSLQIQGFKSFPDKTTLHFDRGITAVVGPNGSGKSNISDAMGWVMGEQSVRNLRGEKMEDVIFLGTDRRKATGFAFVALTFDNTDHTLPIEADEVTISRKLYRSGESEYRINHAAVRLRDINELLMDTGLGRDGYSIIGQGRIDEIVSAKSTQRREIFEEAAGISKYRYRKEEAEKKLEAAYENLLRLKDIMAELEDRVGPLRLQAEKAQTFLSLSEEKKLLEISLWMDSIRQLLEQIRAMDEQTLIAKNEVEDIRACMEEHTAQLEGFYTQLQKHTIEIEANRARSSSLTQKLSELDSSIAVLENDILHNTASISELTQEKQRFGQNQEALLDALRKNQEEASAGKQRLLQTAQEKEELEQREAELALQSRQCAELVSLLKSKRSSCEQDIALQKLNRASSSTLLEETRQRLKAAQQSQENREERHKSLQSEHKNCQSLLEAIDEKLTRLSASRLACEEQKSSLHGQLEELSLEQQRLEQEAQRRMHQARVLQDMERSMEGFQNSVKQIMKASQASSLQGVHGPVSQLITVEPSYALAIETALGASMQSIVVENEECAKNAISYLKRNQSGRATFLPLTTIRPQHLQQDGLERERGFVGIAARLTQAQEQYRAILENLLGRIVVAQTIDDAVTIARKYGYKFRIVTLDGQLVNAGGSLTGGSSVKNAGLLSRRGEIEQISQQVKELQAQRTSREPQIVQIKQQLEQLKQELSSLDSQIRTAQEDRITYHAEEKRLLSTIAEMQKAQQLEREEYDRVQKRLEEVERTSQCAQDVIERASQELFDISQRLADQRERQDALTQQRQSLQDKINETRFLILSLTKDQESLSEAAQRMRTSQNQQEQQLQSLEDKLSQLKGKNTQITQEKEQKKQEKQQAVQDVEQTAQRIEALLLEQQKLEQTLTQMRARDKQYISQKEQACARLQRLEDKRLSMQIESDKLVARLWDDYQMTRSQASQLAQTVEDVIAVKARLSELKTKIRELGVINVGAIEEYEEVSQRHRFLKKQMTDIEHSRTELIHLIHDLTSQMQELFLTNFQEIARHFSDIFSQLFGGGHGQLVLTSPEDVLSSGIDIRVQPPGKIIKTLSSLSGGEKALIAISIYFAILRVKPSPFCILDEIEAALDEVNVARYAHFLRSLTAQTQFISITHRRGTMEEADVLYGVTMQEKGVSRLLELDVAKVESELGIKTM